MEAAPVQQTFTGTPGGQPAASGTDSKSTAPLSRSSSAMPSVEQAALPHGEWHTGFFQVTAAPGGWGLCLKGFCCPCCVVGEVGERLEEGLYWRDCVFCFLIGVASLCSVQWCNWELPMRDEVAYLYNIPDRYPGFKVMCCEPCAMIQVANHLRYVEAAGKTALRRPTPPPPPPKTMEELQQQDSHAEWKGLRRGASNGQLLAQLKDERRTQRRSSFASSGGGGLRRSSTTSSRGSRRQSMGSDGDNEPMLATTEGGAVAIL